MPEVRKEEDSLGVVEVPAIFYYGAQTARTVKNYPISRLECPANSVPVGVTHTGIEGVRNVQGQEAHA